MTLEEVLAKHIIFMDAVIDAIGSFLSIAEAKTAIHKHWFEVVVPILKSRKR